MKLDELSFSSGPRKTVKDFAAHDHYQTNMQLAWKMHHKWKESDSPEIWTMVRDSEHDKKCLFTIAFSPDKRAPMGKYAADVWMQQSRESFLKECESIRKATLSLFKQYFETFKNEIPKWKQLDESYWHEYLQRRSPQDVQKLIKNLTTVFKAA